MKTCPECGCQNLVLIDSHGVLLCPAKDCKAVIPLESAHKPALRKPTDQAGS